MILSAASPYSAFGRIRKRYLVSLGRCSLWPEAELGQVECSLNFSLCLSPWPTTTVCWTTGTTLQAGPGSQALQRVSCRPRARGWMSSPFPMYVFQAPSLILQFFLLPWGSSLLILLRMGLLKNDRLSEADRRGGVEGIGEWGVGLLGTHNSFQCHLMWAKCKWLLWIRFPLEILRGLKIKGKVYRQISVRFYLCQMPLKTSWNIQQTENAAGWVCFDSWWALSPTSSNKAVAELKAI